MRQSSRAIAGCRLPARSHRIGTVRFHMRHKFRATLKAGEAGPKAPGGRNMVSDWAAHFERERSRYEDGDARLPGLGEPDDRQRQLTRMRNAAAGAGLALLMAGRRDEAAEWFARAAERYRESFPDAPPGSWGRPIGAIKARLLADD